MSLDAPTVATVWTWFIARAAGFELPWTDVAAMFVAVWVLYAADRLLDAKVLDARALTSGAEVSGLEARHWFHHRHRVVLRWGIALGCLALAALLPSMTWPELKLYLALGALLVAWLLLIHTGARPGARALPKELVVGVFFAAAVFVPAVARAPQLGVELLAPAALFGMLCSLNCVFIFAWEHEGGSDFAAHVSTSFAARRVVWLSCGLAAAALGSMPFVAEGLRWILAAIAAAAGLLLHLHWRRERMERTTLRALADLVLLTPSLLMLVR